MVENKIAIRKEEGYNLTLEKAYPIIEEECLDIYVLNDKGIVDKYLKERFKIISIQEFNKKKILQHMRG